MSPGTPSPDTVYVLGAGFSREANVPLQNEILNSIRSLSLSDAPPALVTDFLQARNTTAEFLRKAFGDEALPSLEDVFTLLDQTIDRRQYCLGKSWHELDTINRALCKAILFLFHIKERTVSKEGCDFYKSIGAYLIGQRYAAGQAQHPFSVISLNWDCILDKAVYSCLEEGKLTNADIDYCCYSTPIPESSRHTPSLAQKPTGLFNIKFMKLHGSTNWLLCPNCSRLYTGLGAQDDIWTRYILGTACPRCSEIQAGIEGLQDNGISPPELEPFLITPTFVKKFENPHIRMVWHNANLDLCEASKVVFIGYSLPKADYHLRTLFKRAIRRDAEISVVLTEHDKRPDGSEQGDNLADYAEDRYKDFFRSSAKLDFCFDGVKGYFKNLIGSQTLEEQMKSIMESSSKSTGEQLDIARE